MYLVNHHLQTDNAPPLHVQEDDGMTLLHDETDLPQPANHDCDQIVIFSLFPGSNAGIQDVSLSHFLHFLYCHM